MSYHDHVRYIEIFINKDFIKLIQKILSGKIKHACMNFICFKSSLLNKIIMQ